MKRIVLFILSLSLLGGAFHIQTVSAEEEYEIPEESIISGDGSADNPYVVDEETEGFLLDMALKENGLISSSKPGLRKAKAVSGTETLTKILTGKAHKKQTKGGYWLYKSSKPNVIYNGMIWMKQVQYVSYKDTLNMYLNMDDEIIDVLKKGANILVANGLKPAVSYLVKKGIAKSIGESILKGLGWTPAKAGFTVAEILRSINSSFVHKTYREAVKAKKGIITTKFMTSYQGQWYAHTSTEIWTNYSTAKEPGSGYRKGTYKSF